MLTLIHLIEGLRMFKRARRVKKHGWKKYKGDAKEICSQIIKECYNGQFFQTSAGHFCEFWTRDFGWCVDSLLKLGYKKECKNTVSYAMNCFKKHDKITTTINPKGIPFDFPYYATDSVPFFIRTLRITNSTDLIKQNKDFLNKNIDEYFEKVIDKETGLVRKDKHFSSIKDYAKRVSSCYDNCMVAMLSNELKKIKVLNNPFKRYDYQKLIIKNFWKKTHFIDDLSGYDFITGDANIFPFWCNIIKDKKMFQSILKKIKVRGLDSPFPLRYYHKKIKEHDMISVEIFAKDYERDTIWGHLGMVFLDVISKYDKKELDKYLKEYVRLVEKNQNLLEVFHDDMKPYETFFYHADESMLWSSILLEKIS